MIIYATFMLHYLCNCTRIQKSNKNLLMIRKSKKRNTIRSISMKSKQLGPISTLFLGDFWAILAAMFWRFRGVPVL